MPASFDPRTPPSIGEQPPSTLRSALAGEGLALDYGAAQVRLRSSLPHLADHLRTVYGAFAFDPAPRFSDVHVELVPGAGLRRFVRPQVRMLVDRQMPFEPFPREAALPLFEWGVNWHIGLRFLHVLLLHAGAVALENRAALLAAPPGSGKSTLTAALMLSGFRLLSDEFGVVDPHETTVHALLKPIALKNQSIEVIRQRFTHASIGPMFPNTRKGDVAHVAPDRPSVALRAVSATPRVILFPRYEHGAGLVCTSMSPSQAFARLAFNSFNYGMLGSLGFEALANTVERCSAHELIYSDLSAAIETVARLLDGS